MRTTMTVLLAAIALALAACGSTGTSPPSVSLPSVSLPQITAQDVVATMSQDQIDQFCQGLQEVEQGGPSNADQLAEAAFAEGYTNTSPDAQQVFDVLKGEC